MMLRIRFKSSPPRLTERTALIQDLFGVGLTPHTVTIAENLSITLAKGKILLITGASGTGKSSLLKAVKKELKKSVVDADGLRFPSHSALIDSIPGSFSEVLGLLSMVGLGEAHLMLRPYDELSEGQKLRARMALAIAKSKGEKVILIDEFCSTLDRLTAYVVSYNLRRIVDRLGLCVVVATALDDILYDLQPDEHLHAESLGVWKVATPLEVPTALGHHSAECRSQKTQLSMQNENRAAAGASLPGAEASPPCKRPISFFNRLSIRRGERRDWERFAHFHYKSHNLGIVDRIYLLCLDGSPIGVVVYAFPQMGCSLRNRVTGGRYTGTAATASARKRLLNEEVRVVQRIVIEPRFRGLGLAAALLRSTIPLLGVRFVECLAVMGGFSRFLQKAGFVEVGRMELPREGRILLGELRGCGLTDVELHDEKRLEEVLRRRCEESEAFGELLRRWFKQRSFIKGGNASAHGTRLPPLGMSFAKDTALDEKREPCPSAVGSGSGGISAGSRGFPVKKVAKAIVESLTSRPFYFICDVKALKEREDEDGEVETIPVEGE